MGKRWVYRKKRRERVHRVPRMTAIGAGKKRNEVEKREKILNSYKKKIYSKRQGNEYKGSCKRPHDLQS